MSSWIVDIPYTAHKVAKTQPLTKYFLCELAYEGCRGVQLIRAAKPGLKEKIMDGGEQTVDDHSAKWAFVYDVRFPLHYMPPFNAQTSHSSARKNWKVPKGMYGALWVESRRMAP